MASVELTPDEAKLIEAIRKMRVSHGRIPCIIYIQDGKLVRVEFEKVVESVKLA